MLDSTPHAVIGPVSMVLGGILLKAVSAKYGNIVVEYTRRATDRVWLLVAWKSGSPDAALCAELVGFCNGIIWLHKNGNVKE